MKPTNAADFCAHLRRGFAVGEYAARTEQMQRQMATKKVTAILLTTAEDIRYFTGFFTPFFLSPTRPWFVVIPADGKPIAIIPEIGHSAMAKTWVDDIRCWPSPRPADDGVSLLAATLQFAAAKKIGMPLGAQSAVRMPVNDLQNLIGKLRGVEVVDIAAWLHRQRMIKSAAEVAKIARCCKIVSDAFAALTVRRKMTERETSRQLRLGVINRGADDIPYLAAASGEGGYDAIIMPPGERALNDGDILMLDVGAVVDGYFCDFNRNFAIGEVCDAAKNAHRILHSAIDAGFAAAKIGATTTDIWRAMNSKTETIAVCQPPGARFGHGIGMQLTEYPSLTADDNTPLQSGMVITLEPAVNFLPGKQMVLEENIVLGEDGAIFLSDRAAPELVIV